jgi:hypothetical protein
MNYNIIIIGANENEMQASHKDMCLLMNLFEKGHCQIFCYDPLYEKSGIIDDICYKKELFLIGDTHMFEKDAKNIVIEFCNLLDENAIHHNLYQHMSLLPYKGYNMVFLSCGCDWNKGFPIESIMYIIQNDNIITPIDALSVDSFLYAISSIHYIYQNKLEVCSEPYIKGLYQVLGSLKWRKEESEYILRELLQVLGNDIPELSEIHRDSLREFVNSEKQWNKLPWQFRESISMFIYKVFV